MHRTLTRIKINVSGPGIFLKAVKTLFRNGNPGCFLKLSRHLFKITNGHIIKITAGFKGPLNDNITASNTHKEIDIKLNLLSRL